MSGATANTACPVKAMTASRPARHGGTRVQRPSAAGNRPAAAAVISPASDPLSGGGIVVARIGCRWWLVKVDVDALETLTALGLGLASVRVPVAGRQEDVVGEGGEQRPGVQADNVHDVDLH